MPDLSDFARARCAGDIALLGRELGVGKRGWEGRKKDIKQTIK